MIELEFIAEHFGLTKAYLADDGSLILYLEKNNKSTYRKLEDVSRFLDVVNRVEPPLSSELMLNILAEKIIKAKEEMEKELNNKLNE
jgi:hypothetical protein